MEDKASRTAGLTLTIGEPAAPTGTLTVSIGISAGQAPGTDTTGTEVQEGPLTLTITTS